MKKLFILILAVSFIFTGCERNYDINERLIVQGVGIDFLSENEVEVTVQALNTDTYSGIGGAKVPENLVKNYSLKGKSVADALSKLEHYSHMEPLYTHTRIVLVGKRQAQEGLRDVIDYFSRDSSCHATLFVALCFGKASDYFTSGSSKESIPAVQIENAVGASKTGADSAGVHIYELIKMYREKTTSAFLPIVSLKEDKNKTVTVEKTAVFDSDRLVSEINGSETQLLMLFLNRIKYGIYTLDGFDGDASFEFYKTRCAKSVAFKKDGTLNYKVNLSLTVDCVEYSGKKDMPLDEKMQKELETMLENELSQKMRAFLEKMCSEKTDCMRLGRILLLKMPELYREKEDSWKETLPSLSFDITVDVSLRRIGQESGKSAL